MLRGWYNVTWVVQFHVGGTMSRGWHKVTWVVQCHVGGTMSRGWYNVQLFAGNTLVHEVEIKLLGKHEHSYFIYWNFNPTVSKAYIRVMS